MKIAAAALFVCLTALPLSAQDPGKMEAEAKRAFDAGRFQEAGEKYAKAAEAADLTADRKSELSFQSAWAYFIGGNSKAARENMKAAFTARPNLEIVADFYSPDFVRMAQVVRAEVAGSSVPAPEGAAGATVPGSGVAVTTLRSRSEALRRSASASLPRPSLS